jgi:hypothetical protein
LYGQRYVGDTGVATATGMTFAVARRQAEAILADEESPPESYEIAGQALVTLHGFAKKFALTRARAAQQAGRKPLPRPVLHHGGQVHWLEDGCERWRECETAQREGVEDVRIVVELWRRSGGLMVRR